MAPVQLKYVVSFSSQDPKNPVENLLKGDSSRKWLSCLGEKTGQLQAEFQLDRACFISHIDIGAYWAFTVQIQVGRSSWPQGKDYPTLLAATSFMTPADCRTGKNKVSIKMFKQENFDGSARTEQWDRLRVSCTQPFRKDMQFGLCFLKVVAEDDFSSDEGMSPKNTKKIPTTPNASPQNNQVIQNSARRKTTKTAVTPTHKLQDIHQHFFGEKSPQSCSKLPSVALKKQLVKIGSSAENGCEQSVALSRTTKLVLTAAGQSPMGGAYPGGHSTEDGGKKKKVAFDTEVDHFLRGLKVEDLDVEQMTFADLRHKLEKLKYRKLSKDERHIFFKKAQTFMEKILDERDSILHKVTSSGGVTVNGSKTSGNRSHTSLTVMQAFQNEKNEKTEVITDTKIVDAKDSAKGRSKKRTKAGPTIHTVMSKMPHLIKQEDSPRKSRNKANGKEKEETEVQQCPLCNEFFQQDMIEQHAASCQLLISDESDDDSVMGCSAMCSSPQAPQSGASIGYGAVPPSRDYMYCSSRTECPICGRLIPSEAVEAHANWCVETVGSEEASQLML